MPNILHELYHGNIRPSTDRPNITEEYRSALKNILALEEQLLTGLNDKNKALYNQLSLAMLPTTTLDNASLFENAFKLGVKFTLACLHE